MVFTRYELYLPFQIMKAQLKRDINIFYLIDTMAYIYAFVHEAEPLLKIQSHRIIMTRLAQQIIDCGYLISAYCDSGFCMSDFLLQAPRVHHTDGLPPHSSF